MYGALTINTNIKKTVTAGYDHCQSQCGPIPIVYVHSWPLACPPPRASRTPAWSHRITSLYISTMGIQKWFSDAVGCLFTFLSSWSCFLPVLSPGVVPNFCPCSWLPSHSPPLPSWASLSTHPAIWPAVHRSLC